LASVFSPPPPRRPLCFLLIAAVALGSSSSGLSRADLVFFFWAFPPQARLGLGNPFAASVIPVTSTAPRFFFFNLPIPNRRSAVDGPAGRRFPGSCFFFSASCHWLHLVPLCNQEHRVLGPSSFVFDQVRPVISDLVDWRSVTMGLFRPHPEFWPLRRRFSSSTSLVPSWWSFFPFLVA